MFEVRSGCGLLLSEVSEGVSVEEVRAATGCNFEVSNGDTPFLKVTISLSLSVLGEEKGREAMKSWIFVKIKNKKILKGLYSIFPFCEILETNLELFFI